MGNMRKYYSGSIASEEIAAKFYDMFQIQNFGLKAKTNFVYRRRDLVEIIRSLEASDEKTLPQNTLLVQINVNSQLAST